MLRYFAEFVSIFLFVSLLSAFCLPLFVCFLIGNYFARMESLPLLPSDSGRILELLEGGLLPLQLQHLQTGLQLLLRLPIIEDILT